MIIASPGLLASSTASVVTTATPTTVEGARAVTGDNNENKKVTNGEGDSSTSSEMAHEVFENNEEKNKKRCAYRQWYPSVEKKEKNRACSGRRGS